MQNTGYKSFETLEKYFTDDGTSTGETKPNIVTDPDYIAPVQDFAECPPTERYYNTVQTKTVTKNNCGVGYAGSPVTLTTYANQFVSNVSLTDANNKALAWLDGHAQSYANIKGTCTIVNDKTAPDAPVIYSTLLENGLSIQLSWNIPYDDVGISSYKLYRKAGIMGTWILYRNVNPGNVTSFTDVQLNYDTTYYYQIQALDTSNKSSVLSNETGQITREGGPFCFVEGTLITLEDGTQKTIESLSLNQLLLSSEIDTLKDTNDITELYKWSCNSLLESRITSPITSIKSLTAHKTIIINDGLLEATPNHSQLIQRNGVWKFIPIQNVIIGDNLYSINRKIIPVISIIINLEKRNIYPLSLNPSHTYFANGILTHNIKPIDN